MLSEKSVLLERIQTAINNKSCNKEDGFNTTTSTKDIYKVTDELYDERTLSFSRNMEFVRSLENRIKTLEDQNDHLLYFIHFLFENFPDLVRNVFPVENSNAPNHRNDIPYLTRREEEILHLLEKGLCAKEIARNLFICETTVITHKKNLKKKFDAKNTAELISKASSTLTK